MLKTQISLGLLVLVCVVTAKSSSIHLGDKQRKNSTSESSFEHIFHQLELIKLTFENLDLKEKLLEKEISESRNLLLKTLTDLKEQLPTELIQSKVLEQIGKLNSTYHSAENRVIYNGDLSKQSENEFGGEFKENVTSQLGNLAKLYDNLTNRLLNIEQLLNKENQNDIHDEHLNCLQNCNSTYGLLTNCADATYRFDSDEGAFVLDISNTSKTSKPFYAYCVREQGKGTAWTVIQRREDGSEIFNRNWVDYKHGFGNVYGEYWIGLERLHEMTSNQTYELWILLKDYDGEKRYAKYSEFSIGSESDSYELLLGEYSGNAGDSLRHHRNSKFSTFDKDSDRSYLNCARSFKSGWWYVACYNCNLNGVYYSQLNKNTTHGLNWNTWKGFQESLRFSQMAIRPVNN